MAVTSGKKSGVDMQKKKHDRSSCLSINLHSDLTLDLSSSVDVTQESYSEVAYDYGQSGL